MPDGQREETISDKMFKHYHIHKRELEKDRQLEPLTQLQEKKHCRDGKN